MKLEIGTPTIKQLLDTLQKAVEDGDGDLPILIAHNDGSAHAISGVVVTVTPVGKVSLLVDVIAAPMVHDHMMQQQVKAIVETIDITRPMGET